MKKKYTTGGEIQSLLPLLDLAVPGLGTSLSAVVGMIPGKQQTKKLERPTNPFRTFRDGGIIKVGNNKFNANDIKASKKGNYFVGKDIDTGESFGLVIENGKYRYKKSTDKSKLDVTTGKDYESLKPIRPTTNEDLKQIQDNTAKYYKELYNSEFYKRNQTNINTLFIGSSIVKRGFNCELFDSSIAPEYKIKSFNFGINWMGFPETLNFVDNLAIKNSGNLKYVFIELSKLKFIDKENMHTSRSIYWYNLEYLNFIVNAMLNSQSSNWIVRIAAISSHILGYIENKLNIDYWKNVSDYDSRLSRINDSLNVVGAHYTGFDGLLGSVIADIPANSEENVQAAISKFLSDTSGLNNRKLSCAEVFTQFENDKYFRNKFNKIYLNKINEIKDRLTQQGIYVFFVLTPKSDKKLYEELVPLYFQIDPLHRINIADSRLYPELYSVEFAGDETHLNVKGAARFTQILSHEFIRKLSGNKDN